MNLFKMSQKMRGGEGIAHIVCVGQARCLVRVDGVAAVAVDASPAEENVAAVDVGLPSVAVQHVILIRVKCVFVRGRSGARVVLATECNRNL
jgi:hypothetical protein